MSRLSAASRTLFLKDLKLAGPLVLLCSAFFLAHALIPAQAEWVRQIVDTLSTCANVLLIVSVIHLDAPASTDVDWLIRPIAGGWLLATKLAFLLIMLLLPSFASDFAHRLLTGAPASSAFNMAMLDHFVGLAVGFPILAVAALTTTLVEAGIVGVAAGALAVVVVPLALLTAGHSPDAVSTQKAWPIILALGLLAMIGSALVLWLQYVPRRIRAARFAFAATALLITLAQLGFAFSVSQ